MNYPDGLLSAFILICEHALQEEDGPMSAIRIVDVFNVEGRSQTPAEQHAAAFDIVAVVKVSDEKEHLLEVDVKTPGGILRPFMKPVKRRLVAEKYPDAPSGLNMKATALMAVQELGLYFLILKFDGVEVAQTPFTLRRQDEQSTTFRP